jgi:hypothetical protein
MWLFGEGSDQYDYKPMKLLEHVQKHSVTTNPVTVTPVLPTFSAGLIQHIIATNQHLPEIAIFCIYPHKGDRIENQSVIIRLIGSGYLL